MSYIMEHTVLFDHFSWVYVLAVLFLLAVVFYCHRKVRKMKNEQRDMEEALAAKYVEASMNRPDSADTESPER